MEIKYSIVLRPEVITQDIPKLDHFWKQEIRDSIRSKLTVAPEIYGKPLRRALKGIRALRVGDYRVVFTLRGRVVHVLGILHRSVVYEKLQKRR